MNKITIEEKLQQLLNRIADLEEKVEELHEIIVSNNIKNIFDRNFIDSNGNSQYLNDEEYEFTRKMNSNW